MGSIQKGKEQNALTTLKKENFFFLNVLKA